MTHQTKPALIRELTNQQHGLSKFIMGLTLCDGPEELGRYIEGSLMVAALAAGAFKTTIQKMETTI